MTGEGLGPFDPRDRPVDDWIDGLAATSNDRKHVLDESSYEALRGLGVRAIPALTDALAHPDWRVRYGAAWLLGELGPAAACAGSALQRGLRDVRARVRRAAAEALRRIGPAAREAAPALLVRLSDDPDPEVRTRAATALGEVGAAEPIILETLAQALADGHAPLRAAAAGALGLLAGGIDSVAGLLEEQLILDEETRPVVAAALARCVPERLVRLLLDDPNLCLAPNGRRGFEVLRRLAALGPEAAPVRRAFVALLSTPARVEALYALGRVGAEAMDAVPEIARTPDEPARAALRSIYFSSWMADEGEARAHPARWRERMLQRFRKRWRRTPPGEQDQQVIEEMVRGASRSDILAVRLQRGDVTRDRVGLAAALGDRTCVALLDLPCPPGEQEALDEAAFTAWAEALQAQPLEVRARIGHAVARDVSPLIQEWYLGRWDALSIHALEDWLRAPSADNRERMAEAQRQLGVPTQGWEGNSSHAGWAVVTACDPMRDQNNPRVTLAEALRAWRVNLWHREPLYQGRLAERPFDLEALPVSEAIARLRRVVRVWVVPWALDEADPVHEALHRLSEDCPEATTLGP